MTVAPLSPLPAATAIASRADLLATLRRIDGWGPRAWLEAHGAWRLRHALLVVESFEAGASGDDEAVRLHLIIEQHGFGRDFPPVPVCDWVARQAQLELFRAPAVSVRVLAPAAAIRASNGCWCETTANGPRLVISFLAWLPFAGMCVDSPRFRRFVAQLDAFARMLARPPRAWRAHVRAWRVQQALRAALPAHGLVAFVGAGSRLARTTDGRATGEPLRVPKALAVTIDCGALGRITGLGIRAGVTAIGGAPYHGKSTLLTALAAGADDHPPGDGRECVVADAGTVVVQVEEGRRVKRQDLSGFFPRLPHSDARAFTTDRASGATSMAATVLQAVAAGARLLLIDEDTAAANFLAIDDGMRRLLGRDLDGTATLLEVLLDLARQGISTVLIAGSHLRSFAPAERVLIMRSFQPTDATRAAKRAAGPAGRITLGLRPRLLNDVDVLFGARHFLDVDAREPERALLLRPGADAVRLDLRRAGCDLDEALVRGALAAAAWCCRWAAESTVPTDLRVLSARYAAFIAAHGACGLDPFHTQPIAAPRWALVAMVLERLPRPLLMSG